MIITLEIDTIWPFVTGKFITFFGNVTITSYKTSRDS